MLRRFGSPLSAKFAFAGRWAAMSASLTTLLVIGSCVNDKIVYRNVQFPQPAPAAKNFVGYSQNDTKQTTCGNCHIDQQTKWAATHHAKAWDDLKATGRSTPDCEGCHSVNDRGNITTDASAGYTSTKDARYEDVQCESCHGPGLDHVTAPTSNFSIVLRESPFAAGSQMAVRSTTS